MYPSRSRDPLLVMYILVAFTTSFDLFLVFNIAGFNFRFAQLVLLIPFVIWLLTVLKNQKLKMPVGSISLLIWAAFICLFIPHTTFLFRNIGYAVWLIFNIVLIFAMVIQINTKEKILKFMKWYIYSFVFVAAFGIAQFIMPYIGITPPFISQYWRGVIPRVSGFSYEPSYYATYMLIGWVLTFYLIEKRSSLFARRTLFIFLGLVTVAMILCSSRMGIGMMCLWIGRLVFLFIVKGFRSRSRRQVMKILGLSFMGLFSVVVIAFLFVDFSKFKFLLNGTGLAGQPAQSVNTRLGDLMDTLHVFMQNPFYGVSLGGVAPAIGGIHGLTVTSQAIATKFEGMMIFAEVLAASGVIGFIFFAVYILTLIFKPIKISKEIEDDEFGKILMGSVWALIGILMILEFNQNILRVYLWFHMAVVSALYSVALKQPKKRTLTEKYR